MVQTSPTPTPFDVGRAFVHQYYTLLHQAPHLLHRFYSNDSTFIHGGVDRPGCVEQPAVGPENISQRINDLNLRDCHAKIRQVDSHPTIGNGVVVQVTGELSNNGDPMRRFMQTFVLAPRQPKKYYVQNDIFRYQDEVFDDGSDEVDEDDRSSSHIYGDTISNVDKVSNADSLAATGALGNQQPLLVTAQSRSVVPESQQPLPPRSNGPVMPNTHNQVINHQVTRSQDHHQHVESVNSNGYSAGNASDGTSYGNLNHGHIQTAQDSNASHSQPSPRQNNHTVVQETAPQQNGGSTVNQSQGQQPVSKQLGQNQQTSSSTGETPRAEGTSYAGVTKLTPSTASAPNANVTGTNSTSNQRAPSAPVGVPNNVTSQPAHGNRPSVKSSNVPNGRTSHNPQMGQNNNSQGRGGNNSYYSQNNRANVITAPNENQIFVGSLPPEFTHETLKQIFSAFGNVLDAKIHHANGDNKKNFGFVVFDNPEAAANLVTMAHVNYNESIRLNIEAKTPRNNSSNSNSNANYNNGSQGGRPSGYPPRGGGRGGNRGLYRGGNNNPRRGGGQYNNSSLSFTASDDPNYEYRSNKMQQQQQQQPQQQQQQQQQQ